MFKPRRLRHLVMTPASLPSPKTATITPDFEDCEEKGVVRVSRDLTQRLAHSTHLKHVVAPLPAGGARHGTGQ